MKTLLLATAALMLPLAAAQAEAAPPADAPPADAPMPGMDHAHMHHDMAGMDMGGDASAPGHDMAAMPGMAGMAGALGDYPMTREASGTAWQPDASTHAGVHGEAGGWSTMAHAAVNLTYDSQSGPRGDDKAFVSGMVMGMARRDLAPGTTLQLRAMLSPDPLMGARGYPLLLATGETADGKTALVDRQHPHDLFMELSASLSWRLAPKTSAFVYAGLPGEPAFGPPAFMHRLSILDSPEAPIAHHWLDSTHITFGVVTAGVIYDTVKLEASRFRGREPDEHRYNIETGALDSTAVRASWNPSRNWSLQASWADVKSPEELEPDKNVRKWSASAIYTRPFGDGGWWSTTAAWGRRTSDDGDLDAWILESAVKPNAAWTIFARGERTQNDELVFAAGHHGPAYTVGKASIGAIRDWTIAPHTKLGLGGLYSVNWVPSDLKPVYGGTPHGAMAFLRLKID